MFQKFHPNVNKIIQSGLIDYRHRNYQLNTRQFIQNQMIDLVMCFVLSFFFFCF
jgi:hypothetical protein